MQDVRSLSAKQPYELEEAGEVPPGSDRAADVAERDEPDAGFLGCSAKRPGSVRCDDDIEALDDGGQERRDIRLSPTDLGQRDQQQKLRSRHQGAVRTATPGGVACDAA